MERPIIFSTDMIKAILRENNPKTQTRRVIKPQPERLGDIVWDFGGEELCFIGDEAARNYLFHEVYGNKGTPYGSIYVDGSADRLWVKETFCPEGDAGAVWYKAGIPDYRLDRVVGWEDYPYRLDNYFDPPAKMKWRSPIFMPRWASRITLEITDVRVERLGEISESDAEAEGRPEWTRHVKSAPLVRGAEFHDMTAREWFEALWDSINAKRGYSWQSNPWVWVIDFRRVTEH